MFHSASSSGACSSSRIRISARRAGPSEIPERNPRAVPVLRLIQHMDGIILASRFTAPAEPHNRRRRVASNAPKRRGHHSAARVRAATEAIQADKRSALARPSSSSGAIRPVTSRRRGVPLAAEAAAGRLRAAAAEPAAPAAEPPMRAAAAGTEAADTAEYRF